MAHFLLLQNSSDTPLGSTELWLKKNNHSVTQLKSWEIESFPNLDSYDYLILGGGGANVDEETQKPWLTPLKSFIKTNLNANKKILGICLGAQLLAEQLGAKVYRHKHHEIGWHKVQIDINKNYFNFSKAEILVFQYHAYTYELPAGATRISHNEITPQQAFTFGYNVAAFQFHPEATKEWAIECATDVKEPLPVGPFCQTKEEILELTQQHQETLQRWYFDFLSSFFKT